MRKFRLRLPEMRRKKKNPETSFANFSFNTITSMTLKKDCRLVKHYKIMRERLVWQSIKDQVYSGSNRTKRELVLNRVVPFLGIVICLGVLVARFRNDYVQGFLSKSYFAKVETVKIEGLDKVAVADVYQASGIVRFQTSMLDVEAKDVEEKLEQLIWVDDAKVSLKWPSTVKVRIREQVPLAIVHTPTASEQFKYLNRKGELFTAVNKKFDMDFPVITGLEKLHSERYEESVEQVLLFLKKVARNNPVLPIHSVSEIYVDEKGQLIIYLVDHAFPIYVGGSSIDNAYKYLVRILGDVYSKRHRGTGTKIAKIGYIQLDYMKDQVLVAENSSG